MAGKQKGRCPTCGAMQNVSVLAKHDENEVDDDGVFYSTIFRVVQCGGCDDVFFQRERSSSDEFEPSPDGAGYEPVVHLTHYPPSKRKRPNWMLELVGSDMKLHALLEETYRGLDADLKVLAAIGLRTTLDRATEKLGIDAELPFAEKLGRLRTEEHIGQSEKDILEVLIDAGSAAAHRGWRPTDDDLGTMVDIVEGFLKRNFILAAKAKALKGIVSAKQRAKKKPTKGSQGKKTP